MKDFKGRIYTVEPIKDGYLIEDLETGEKEFKTAISHELYIPAEVQIKKKKVQVKIIIEDMQPTG